MVPPKPPWSKSVGQSTTFYLEGGHGQNYWAGGWHLGTIRALPIKGQKKGFAQVELACTAWGWSDGRGHNRNGTPLPAAQLKTPRGYYRRDSERYWVNAHNLNEPGDTTYHGPRLNEVVAERQEEKAAQQARALRALKPKPQLTKRQKSSHACPGLVERGTHRPAVA